MERGETKNEGDKKKEKRGREAARRQIALTIDRKTVI